MIDFEQDLIKIREFCSKLDLSLKPTEIIVEQSKVQEFDFGLGLNIQNNTQRYIEMFYKALDEFYPQFDSIDDQSSPLEVLLYQRKEKDFPAILTRRFTVVFKGNSKDLSVREIKGSHLGHLINIKGMVTRVSNVKPFCVVCAYSCDQCGNEVFQEIESQSWIPLDQCPSAQCKANAVRGKLHMQTRGSKFLKFQEIKIQELTDQVPMGHIPRSMTVHLKESLVRKANPGEIVSISGIFLPVPFTGFKAMRAGLLTDTYLDAQFITQHKAQYRNMDIGDDVMEQINDIVQKPKVYDRLAASIAPEIYGHDDVKKALLLMLVGGATKETPDGMKVRGDLNICLMGDPGVAKSQLLKHISKIAPRAVYTTGRGSSGVGLTASVTKDPVTEEMVLEGGALVLADNGIACIDEFDKMDETDRTAIHEVMEQQTISISKAGITTTLNARTSILAAANPQYGRYNPRLKPTDNINLPAALLSRFDLLFLLLDTPSLESDLKLAQHVTFVHRNQQHPPREQEIISEAMLKRYIALARNFNPQIPPSVGDFLVNAYVYQRQSDKDSEGQYTSARVLLGLIRLSSALARLRFSEEIQVGDVEEALRLMEVSKVGVVKPRTEKRDTNSIIFDAIRQLSAEANGNLAKEVSMITITERIISKGFTEKQLQDCIKAYTDDDVWMVVGRDQSKLRWLRVGEE